MCLSAPFWSICHNSSASSSARREITAAHEVVHQRQGWVCRFIQEPHWSIIHCESTSYASNPWTSLVVIPKQLMPLWWIRILMVPQVWTYPCADFESRWTGSYNSDILRHLASYSHRTFPWAQRIFRARRWRLPARNWWCPRSDRHPPKDQPVLHLGLRYSCLELQPEVGSRKLSDTWVEAQKASDLLGPQTCHNL